MRAAYVGLLLFACSGVGAQQDGGTKVDWNHTYGLTWTCVTNCTDPTATEFPQFDALTVACTDTLVGQNGCNMSTDGVHADGTAILTGGGTTATGFATTNVFGRFQISVSFVETHSWNVGLQPTSGDDLKWESVPPDNLAQITDGTFPVMRFHVEAVAQ